MSRITWALIRKKTEHHDGLLEDLEELSLHQLNLTKLDTIGRVCPRLKILYLQNNLIPRIENVKRLKSLLYLNLALNNITSVSNEIGHCEKLRKLDLTVNFIDVDELNSSIRALQPLLHLDELYLTGNPATTAFSGYRHYVVHQLPRLTKLDGTDVTRGERLQAKAAFPAIEAELAALAAQKRLDCGAEAEEKRREAERAKAKEAEGKDDDDVAEEEEKEKEKSSTAESYAAKCQQVSAYTPESRTAMHLESAEFERKKAEAQAESNKGNTPDDLWKQAQDKMNAKVVLDDSGSGSNANELPKQRNMGKWDFSVVDDTAGQVVRVEIALQRFLDTSLIDLDVHPQWMQCIVKGKNLLLHFPREINAEQTRVQRIQSTGALILTCPVLKKITTTTASASASGAKGAAAGQGHAEEEEAEEADVSEAELAASEASNSTRVSTHNNVVDLTSSRSGASAGAGSAAAAGASSSRAPAFAKASSGGGLNQVVSDYRHIAKKRTAEEVAARAAIEAQLKEVAVTRSATLEEARLARQQQAKADAHAAAGDAAESERAALERLGLDDTGVPDLE